MSTEIKTTLAHSAFLGKPAERKKRPPSTYESLDLAKITKTRDPYKPERVVLRHKYAELFAGVQEGDCFRLPVGSPPKELSALSRALRQHLKREGINAIIRQSARTDDGVPRVWVLKVLKS